MRTLQQLTRLKRDADEDADLAWQLALDRMIFDTEAESRWLDHCEARLLRHRELVTGPRPVDRRPRAAQGSAR